VANEDFKATIWYTTDFFPAEQRADNCAECGECVKVCPQQINIPEELKKAHAELTKGGPMGPLPGSDISFEE
jgi:predicted aldo/keto reductase-like oxidoreductase